MYFPETEKDRAASAYFVPWRANWRSVRKRMRANAGYQILPCDKPGFAATPLLQLVPRQIVIHRFHILIGRALGVAVPLRVEIASRFGFDHLLLRLAGF